jgi:hypothetical protein
MSSRLMARRGAQRLELTIKLPPGKPSFQNSPQVWASADSSQLARWRRRGDWCTCCAYIREPDIRLESRLTVRIHLPPPASPLTSRSLWKNRKYCAYWRILLILRAPENLSFGQQQLINARFSLSRIESVPFGQFSIHPGFHWGRRPC